ncbi:hypothetical protein SCA6_004830 [Theobroma cacao]
MNSYSSGADILTTAINNLATNLQQQDMQLTKHRSRLININNRPRFRNSAIRQTVGPPLVAASNYSWDCCIDCSHSHLYASERLLMFLDDGEERIGFLMINKLLLGRDKSKARNVGALVMKRSKE